METGGAAETWLDQRLAADDRWHDGVPDDAEPWVSTAFADVSTLSIEELTAQADADDHVASVDAGELEGSAGDTELADVDGSVAVDDWMGDHPSFEAVDDGVAFTVVDADVTALGDADLGDADLGGVLAVDPATMPDTSPAVAEPGPSGLNDPFDTSPGNGATADEADLAVQLDELVDDIVTVPNAGDPDVEPPVEAQVESADEPASFDDVVSETPTKPIADGLGDAPVIPDLAADVDSFDSSLLDPFSALDDGALQAERHDEQAASDVDAPGDDLVDEFGDDSWTDG